MKNVALALPHYAQLKGAKKDRGWNLESLTDDRDTERDAETADMNQNHHDRKEGEAGWLRMIR